MEEGTKPSMSKQHNIELRNYQISGAQWMAKAQKCILADDVGTGKTFTAIEAMQLPALIVTPNHLTLQWFDTLCEHMPSSDISINMPEGARAQRTRELAVPADVTVVNVEMLRTYYQDLAARNYKTLVCDEAQHLRKPRATQSKNAAKLAKHIPSVFLLTASPYYKRVDDVWHLLHIVAPDVFPSYWDFLHEWCAVNWGAPYTPKIYGIKPKLIEAWQQHIAPYMLMRKYADVGRELPPLVENVVTFNLPSELQRHYTTIRNKWRLGGNPIESAGAATVLLRQITMCHEKVNTVLGILDDIPVHEPVLIYVWYRESAVMLADAIARTYRDGHSKTLLVTGAQSDANERSKALAHAQQDGVKYIIATQSALSEGANLQWVRYVIYAEENYVAEAHRQTLARVLRDRGDSSVAEAAPVIAYYVRARRTIDEHIARARINGADSISAVARSMLTDGTNDDT